MKANIDLDTEKLPATIVKCNKIQDYLKNKYTDDDIICGIFNWSIYTRDDIFNDNKLKKKIENIENDIQVIHYLDFLNLIEVKWNKNDFENYFLELGSLIKK